MEYIILAAALFLFIVVVMIREYTASLQYRKNVLQRLYESFGKETERTYGIEEMTHIRYYFKKHVKEDQIDEITWNDFNMDSIYQKMNCCCSSAGDEYLYYRFRTPLYNKQDLDTFEKQVQFFEENENTRQTIQKYLWMLGRSGKYSIYEYMDNFDILGERKNTKYFFWNLMLLVSIAVMFFHLPLGIIMFVSISCHNLLVYYKEYKPVEPYVTSFYYIRRALECGMEIAKLTFMDECFDKASLQDNCNLLKGFVRNSYLVVSNQKGSGNPLQVVVDYFRMLFFIDLILFNKTLMDLRNHIDDIDEIITWLGRADAQIAIASFRKLMENNCCVPDLLENVRDSLKIQVEDIIHPLLKEPISNSIEAEKCILLTGSNASGKSTFLRTVGIAAIMSQTIHTVTAKSYRAPIVRIYSSMSLKDDVLSGDSYYMAEIKSMKRILDKIKENEVNNIPVVCFLDEVLRGTNTVERIAASVQILKMFAGENVICFAATHDVELTKLLSDIYDNYHFEERIEREDVYFPYQLLKGPATTRNAIALLKVLGYDSAIIENAEKMASVFLEKGIWEC